MKKRVLVLNVSIDIDKVLLMKVLEKCEIVFMEDVMSREEVMDFDFFYMHHMSITDVKQFKSTKDIVESFDKVLLGSVLVPIDDILDNQNIVFFLDWKSFQIWFYERINQQ